MDTSCDTVPIKVLCRVRPLNSLETFSGFLPTLHADHISISISDKHFTFDKVFRPQTTQEQVYADGASPIVNDLLKGYNGTIFAYGQTSSGKTYTMEGGEGISQGITPRIITDIFRHIHKLPAHIQASLKISYFEVYMDRIKDLLDVSKVNLPVHEDKHKVPYVKGVTEVETTNMEEVFRLLKIGKSNRSVSVTNMNVHSSRSHSVFLIQLKQTNSQSETSLHGRLYLVDLAGSEKVSKSGAEGITLREAKKINKSLSALGNVISSLADGNKNHVPYRDSKLTRILQQSLGGNSRTSIFICCSPSAFNESETKSSLMFGQRAKTIKNEIQVNEELTAEEWQKRYQKEKEKNTRLRTKLAQLELGAKAKSESPDVIPSPNTAQDKPAASTAAALTAHSSMPCLTSAQLADCCQECLRYQQDITNLCQQLDDKDDELGERSREILSLETEIKNLKNDLRRLAEDNSLLLEEHKSVERKYISGQDEVRSIMTALEELSESYQDKDADLALKLRSNENLTLRNEELEVALIANEEELTKVKAKLEENKAKTISMFRDLFNDFTHVTLTDKLKAAADLYKSTPAINQIPASSTNSSLASSAGSEHSSLCQQSESFSRPSHLMTNSLSSVSSTGDLSPPSPVRSIMTQSMCDLRPNADLASSAPYQGSRAFHDRVDDLKDRLASLLESNYNRVITPPDTSSSYIRNLRLRKMKPLGGGRVFTVFSRAGRKHPKYSTDVMPVQLGRRD